MRNPLNPLPLLGWLRQSGVPWLGAKLSRGRPQEEAVGRERVRAIYRGGIGKFWFLPYIDPYTAETEEMRRAYRQMLRDPTVKAAVWTKLLGAAQLELTVEADGDGPLAKKVAAFVRYALQHAEGGVPGLLLETVYGALLEGFCVAEKVWGYLDKGEHRGNVGLRALKSKDPDRFRLEADDFRNVGEVVAIAGPLERYPASAFVVTRHQPLYRSLGTSDLRAIFRAYWLIDTAWKLRAIHLEKYTSPLLKGTYQSVTDKPGLDAALEQARAATWLTIPDGAKVEAMELSQKGTADFQAAIKDLQHEVFSGIIGAVLQSLEGTVTDARGSSQVHQSVSELFIWYVTYLATTAWNEQLVPDAVDLNYVGGGYPLCKLGAVSDGDLKDSLAIDQGLLQMRVPLSFKEIYQRYKRQPPEDPADTIAPAAPPGPGGGPPGQPGGLPDPADEFADDAVSILTAGRPRALPAPKADAPAPRPAAGGDVALAGRDGERAGVLLRNAVRKGSAALAELSEQAVSRLLAAPRPLARKTLFTAAERAELADALAACQGTARLLGQARVERRAEAVKGGVQLFAEDATPELFADLPLTPLPPTKAADYFLSLIPRLGVDPERFGPLMDRHAFTLAEATEATLLQKVQAAIANALKTGGRGEGKAAVLDTLKAAGVGGGDTSYGAMAFRTNMMDAYNAGAQHQLHEGDNPDLFPAWRYLGIRDGRQGKDHEPHFDRYYPTSAAFAEVRGPRVFNCRCTFAPVAFFEWDELRKKGAGFSSHQSFAEQCCAAPADHLFAGFTGTITDSIGRERHYLNGKQVAKEQLPANAPVHEAANMGKAAWHIKNKAKAHEVAGGYDWANLTAEAQAKLQEHLPQMSLLQLEAVAKAAGLKAAAKDKAGLAAELAQKVHAKYGGGAAAPAAPPAPAPPPPPAPEPEQPTKPGHELAAGFHAALHGGGTKDPAAALDYLAGLSAADQGHLADYWQRTYGADLATVKAKLEAKVAATKPPDDGHAAVKGAWEKAVSGVAGGGSAQKAVTGLMAATGSNTPAELFQKLEAAGVGDPGTLSGLVLKLQAASGDFGGAAHPAGKAADADLMAQVEGWKKELTGDVYGADEEVGTLTGSQAKAAADALGLAHDGTNQGAHEALVKYVSGEGDLGGPAAPAAAPKAAPAPAPGTPAKTAGQLYDDYYKALYPAGKAAGDKAAALAYLNGLPPAEAAALGGHFQAQFGKSLDDIKVNLGGTPAPAPAPTAKPKAKREPEPDDEDDDWPAPTAGGAATAPAEPALHPALTKKVSGKVAQAVQAKLKQAIEQGKPALALQAAYVPMAGPKVLAAAVKQMGLDLPLPPDANKWHYGNALLKWAKDQAAAGADVPKLGGLLAPPAPAAPAAPPAPAAVPKPKDLGPLPAPAAAGPAGSVGVGQALVDAGKMPKPAELPQLQTVKALGGSTGAELVKAPSGQEYVQKKGNNPGHVRSEAAADALYHAAGLEVPRAALYETENGPVKLAKFRAGQTLGEWEKGKSAAEKQAMYAQIGQGFAADALLGNWDVIGAGKDNVLIDKNGKAVRIDNGGALRYRAQGELKKPGEWAAEVRELATLRDAKTNPQAAAVYGHLTDEQVADQIHDLAGKRDAILAAAPPHEKAVLAARLDHLAAWAKAKTPVPTFTGHALDGPVTITPQFPKHKLNGVAYGKAVETNPKLPAASQTYLNHITADQADAIQEYTGSAYGTLNKALYTGKKLAGSAAALHEKLQAAFAHAQPFPAPVAVKRGIDLDGDEAKAFAGMCERYAAAGQPVTLKGYLSTSTTKAFSGNVKLHIHATKGLDVKPLSGAATEDELLLSHGSKFKVLSVEKGGYNSYAIHMEQVA